MAIDVTGSASSFDMFEFLTDVFLVAAEASTDICNRDEVVVMRNNPSLLPELRFD